MDNDERIKQWREKRGEDGVAEQAYSPSETVRPTPRMDRPSAAAPSSDGLDQARNDILDRRRARWQLFMQRVGLFLGLPLLIVFLYVELVATPLYQGEAVFTVQTSGDSAASPHGRLQRDQGHGRDFPLHFDHRAERVLRQPGLPQ